MGKIKRLIAKGLREILQPAAITECEIDKTARICSASHINNSKIGRYSYVGHGCFFVKVTMGKFCSVADGCRVGGASHPMFRVSTSPVFHKGKNILGVNFADFEQEDTPYTYIGNDVWIGANACVKSGVKIGDGAIIGMGSVVTKDIPPYEIWAGNPAKCIRARFDDETVEQLQKSQWWNWDDNEIRENAACFDSVTDFIKKNCE